MSIELEWTSFIEEKNEYAMNGGLSTKSKIKKMIFSPEKTCPQKGETGGVQYRSNTPERRWSQPDNMKESIAFTDDENHQLSNYPSTYAESYSIPSSNTKCSEDDLNRVEKSTKVKEKNNDDRRWTRDVIFEAEQIIIKSEIDSIEANNPSFKKKETTDERILKKPLSEEQKSEINFSQRCISSSTPSLVTDAETFTASFDSGIGERGRHRDFKNEEEVNSKKSSMLNVARKISRSTSKSLKSLNNHGRSAGMKGKNVLDMTVKQQQREGAYALLRAAKNDSVFQIQTLVNHGISTEILDQRGWTPLTIALENENMKCAEVLVQLGANTNYVHANGMTLLHLITSTGMYKGVKFLLRHGANVNAEDSKGWPPVHYAIKQHHLKCTALLLAAGCDSQTYTQKRVKEYEQVVRLATVGKWKYHWQQELDIDMSNEIQL